MYSSVFTSQGFVPGFNTLKDTGGNRHDAGRETEIFMLLFRNIFN